MIILTGVGLGINHHAPAHTHHAHTHHAHTHHAHMRATFFRGTGPACGPVPHCSSLRTTPCTVPPLMRMLAYPHTCHRAPHMHAHMHNVVELSTTLYHFTLRLRTGPVPHMRAHPAHALMQVRAAMRRAASITGRQHAPSTVLAIAKDLPPKMSRPQWNLRDYAIVEKMYTGGWVGLLVGWLGG